MPNGSARSLGQAGARHLRLSARRRRSHACVLCLDNHVACRRSPPAALCRSHVSLGRLRLCRARRRASSPRRCALRGVHATEILGCALLAVVDAAELAVPARNIRSPPWSTSPAGRTGRVWAVIVPALDANQRYVRNLGEGRLRKNGLAVKSSRRPWRAGEGAKSLAISP